MTEGGVKVLDLKQLTELHNSMVKPLRRVKGFKSREEALAAIAKVQLRAVESLDESELADQYIDVLNDKGGNVATQTATASDEKPTEGKPTRKVTAPAKPKVTAPAKPRATAPAKPKVTAKATPKKKVTPAKGKNGRAAEVPGENPVTVTVPDGVQTFRPGSKQAEKWKRFMKNPPKQRTVGTWRDAGFTILDAQGARRKGWITYKE